MRVIILLRILWTAGAQKLALNEARHLLRMGHDVEVVFLRGSHLSGYEDLLRMVRYRVVSKDGRSFLSPVYSAVTGIFAPPGRGSESTVDYNLIRSFPKFIASDPPDQIICHDPWAGLAGYYAWRRLKVPYSVYLHERVPHYDVPFLGRLAHALEARTLRSATRVFAVTDKVADSVRAAYHVNPVTNYIGMDQAGVTPYGEKQNHIISVSMWDDGRLPRRYLDVIDRIPDYDLLFVGKWREPLSRERFIAAVRDRGLRERVRIYQGVTEGELESLYQSSKFAMRFGFGEFGSGSTVESIQHGVPIVLNEDLGTSRLIRQFHAGFVASTIEPSAISDFIHGMDNPDSYASLQENLRHLSKVYSWDRHCHLLLGTPP